MKYILLITFQLLFLVQLGPESFAAPSRGERTLRELIYDDENIVNNPQKCMNFDSEIQKSSIYKNVLARIPDPENNKVKKLESSLPEVTEIVNGACSVAEAKPLPTPMYSVIENIIKASRATSKTNREIAALQKPAKAREKLQQCILASQRIGVRDYGVCQMGANGKDYVTSRPFQFFSRKVGKNSDQKVAVTVSAKPCITPTYNEYIADIYNEGMKCFEKEGIDIESIFGMTYQESKFFHNAKSSTGVLGFKQVTKGAINAVRNNWGKWEEMQKKHPECNTEAINAALESKNEKDFCSAVEMPANPLKNMIFGMLYFAQDKDRATNIYEKAMDILNRPEGEQPDEKIIRDLARYNYNAGYGPIQALFKGYVQNFRNIQVGKAVKACWVRERAHMDRLKTNKQRYTMHEDCEGLRKTLIVPPLDHETFSKEFPLYIKTNFGKETLETARAIGDNELAGRVYRKRKEISGYVRSIRSSYDTLEKLYGVNCRDLETY